MSSLIGIYLRQGATERDRTSEEGQFTPARSHHISWVAAGVNRPSSLVLFPFRSN